MRITVLGLGLMGRALAGRLLDGDHEVTVWNRSPGRAGDLVSRGAAEAADAVSAATGAEVVMTFLAADAAVTDVLLPGGRPLAVDAGTIVVDCSTVAPTTTRRLADAFPGRMVASPVLGRPEALAAGAAGLVVAGPEEILDRLEPLWRSISGAVRRCGDDPGQALVVKLLHNYLLMGGLAVLAEAVATAQRAGLSDELLIDMLGSAPMVAPGLHNRVDDLVSGSHDGWFPPPMGAKDVRLFVDVATAHRTVLPIAEVVAARYEETAASDPDAADITAIIDLVRRSG